jgi:hypothetical protein
MNDIDQIGIYINAFRDRHFTITDKNKPPCEVHLPEPFRHPDELFTALLSHSFDTNSISIVDQNVASYIFIRSLKRMLRSQIMLSAKASLPAR